MVSNFLMGGKLGDFLHSMYAVKHLTKKTGSKANIYLYDVGWELGIDVAVKELRDLLTQQEYINSVSILKDYELSATPNEPITVFDKEILQEGFIDLGGYIRSPWLYKVCWTELYSKTFDFPIDGEYAWIKYPKINSELQNKVLINRRFNPIRLNKHFPYQNILEEYKGRVIFVGSSENDYNGFPYKDEVPFLKMTTLDDWFTAINSCFMFVANLSAPAAMAHSLDKLRIIELPDTPDAIHCVGEEQYSNNVHWYLNNNFHTLH